MDILERTIENLTSDEVRRFKILSNRFKADEEKKMLILFDSIRAGDFKDREEEVIAHLYGQVQPRTKNSYYRLRNKLLNNLEKSLLFYHFNYKNAIEAFSYIQLATLMQERGLYREAYHDLKKAEKAAHVQEQFNVLDIIYDHMVKLAPHCDIDIASVIERRRLNAQRLEVLRANSEILGMVTSELSRRNYARNRRSSNVIETLEQIQHQLEEHEEAFSSASGRIMVTRTVVSILIEKGAYAELASYARKTFEEFEEQGIFNRENYAERLKLRIVRINSLQKLLNLEEARTEIEKLEAELHAHQRAYYEEFAYHYYSNLAFNLKLQGELSRAEQLLKDALSQENILQEKGSKPYLVISLADLYFISHQYQNAVHTLYELITDVRFEELDEGIQLYVYVFILVNLYEAARYDEIKPKLKELKSRYKPLIKDELYGHVRRFLDILTRLVSTATEGKGMHLKAAYRNYLRDFGPGEIGDNEIIRYDLYIQSKAEGQDYFELLREQLVETLQV